jgi:putative spermidine/putrescine transport system substrate-binding protein
MSEKSLTRRELMRRSLVTGGLLAGGNVLAACGGGGGGAGGGGSSKPVVFADYGGSVREAREQAFLKSFAEESGIQVRLADADPARFVLMAEKKRSQWDLIDADGFSIVDWHNRGLLEQLPASVTRCDQVPEQYQSLATGGYTQGFNMVYRRDAFKGAKPESWADFWDVEKFPGKRGFNASYIATIEPALLADGVSKDALYPLDFDRGFAKLDELRPHMRLYQSYAEGQQALQANSVGIAVLPNGRAYALQQQGLDLEIVWNEAIYYPWNGAPVPKGAPNTAGTFELLSYMAKPEAQAEFAKLTAYGPTQSAAFDLLDDKLRRNLPGAPETVKLTAPVDTEVLAEQTDEYIKRFSTWLAKG